MVALSHWTCFPTDTYDEDAIMPRLIDISHNSFNLCCRSQVRLYELLPLGNDGILKSVCLVLPFSCFDVFA